mmetsp:Transcript_19830/g.19940  ORF Transcript_19830/g.19940 Transcript_19830/m.19940 type:complete len:147 (+) Transcript_19830:406-846(+)
MMKKNSKDFQWQKKFEQTEEGAPPPAPVNGTKYPAFALLYKFRKEYLEGSVAAFMADHKGHCMKFKRVLSSELINLGKSRGVVLLWAGLSEDDQEETKAEITTFMEEDPLLVQDAIEIWDLIDLRTRLGDPADLPDSDSKSESVST